MLEVAAGGFSGDGCYGSFDIGSVDLGADPAFGGSGGNGGNGAIRPTAHEEMGPNNVGIDQYLG